MSSDDHKDEGPSKVDISHAKSFFDFTVKNEKKQPTPLSNYQGNVTLVVNVASKCGFTPQYTGLEALYEKYKDQGFTILGFPCNQFGAQEPGNEEEIMQFCSTKYNVTFPIMGKIDVNGDNAEPAYEYMKEKKKQLGMKRIKWNFEKFLIDRRGEVVERYSSLTKPDDSGLTKKIEELLKQPKE